MQKDGANTLNETPRDRGNQRFAERTLERKLNRNCDFRKKNCLRFNRFWFKMTSLVGHSSQEVSNSATRFGEILPLWQIFDGLFLIWQNSEPTLANL